MQSSSLNLNSYNFQTTQQFYQNIDEVGNYNIVNTIGGNNLQNDVYSGID